MVVRPGICVLRMQSGCRYDSQLSPGAFRQELDGDALGSMLSLQGLPVGWTSACYPIGSPGIDAHLRSNMQDGDAAKREVSLSHAPRHVVAIDVEYSWIPYTWPEDFVGSADLQMGVAWEHSLCAGGRVGWNSPDAPAVPQVHVWLE